MPKVIEHLREKILESAKTRVLRDGYRVLTIRDIADDCEIATGTVYNYFPSKDAMIAAVQLDDWKVALQRMREGIAKAETLSQGLFIVRDEIVAFSDIYRGMWESHTVDMGRNGEFAQRHRMIARQLTEVIRPLVDRMFPKAPEKAALLLAENILTTVNSSELTMEDVIEMLAGVEHYSDWK